MEMKTAAVKNNVLLQEAFMYRHHPRIRAAAEMVHSGKIGKIRAIEAAFTYVLKDESDIRNQPEMGGGAVMDVGCYCINIIRLMADREPKTVQANAVWADSGVDAQLVGLLDFGDGLMAHFDCAFNLENRQRCIIAGSEGYFEIPTTFLPGMDDRAILEYRGDLNAPIKHQYKGVDQYRMMIEDFMDGIDSGSVPFPVDDANANMRVIEACLVPAKEGGRLVTL
jgi:predicted dehydrogenase